MPVIIFAQEVNKTAHILMSTNKLQYIVIVLTLELKQDFQHLCTRFHMLI